ncbi:hypothetical protein JM79_3239 [Gramella sp. Hel_I_59]|uniref:hypothetical protein n=1 Tax=Gramella sp. Hel_I_59 TaxID=1249978 RepID=UPI00114EC4E4|nr:hypothetical protein [Gramella sp. Hel_I_59]TQI72281.1 hypothetical protein JM79_3239 [Gramella sp. Hel_I_59]
MGHRLPSGKEYLGVADGKAHYFEIAGREATGSNASNSKEEFSRWNENPLRLGDYQVIPFGTNNDIPDEVQETIFPNHLAPTILDRKSNLAFGQGPYLYRFKPDGSQATRDPIEDAAITQWLDDIDVEILSFQRSVEYYYIDNVFTKIRNLRGSRLGMNKMAPVLEEMTSKRCRLAYRKGARSKKPTHVVVGDWKNSSNQADFEVYPLWDRKNPTKYPISIHYTNSKSFGMEDYALPKAYGTLNWIKRSTAAPRIIEAFTNNSLNIRFHITSPQKFWSDKEQELKNKCKNTQGLTYSPKMLEDLEEQIFDSLSQVLSGIDNVGKFWHNKTVTTMIGNTPVEEGWKITPIKQEVKEYVEAQIKVADKSDFAVQAGLSLHASLANVGADGKSDSGSEQLYAYQIHQLTGIPVAELFICKVFNDVIKAYFKTDIKLGFYQISAQREQDTSESSRTKNQSAIKPKKAE